MTARTLSPSDRLAAADEALLRATADLYEGIRVLRKSKHPALEDLFTRTFELRAQTHMLRQRVIELRKL